jgi:hypothetical protein
MYNPRASHFDLGSNLIVILSSFAVNDTGFCVSSGEMSTITKYQLGIICNINSFVYKYH